VGAKLCLKPCIQACHGQRTIRWPLKCSDRQNRYIRLLFTLTAKKIVKLSLKDSPKGQSTKRSKRLDKISAHGTVKYIDSLARKAWTTNQCGDERTLGDSRCTIPRTHAGNTLRNRQ
jgi:hypothetical protein